MIPDARSKSDYRNAFTKNNEQSAVKRRLKLCSLRTVSRRRRQERVLFAIHIAYVLSEAVDGVGTFFIGRCALMTIAAPRNYPLSVCSSCNALTVAFFPRRMRRRRGSGKKLRNGFKGAVVSRVLVSCPSSPYRFSAPHPMGAQKAQKPNSAQEEMSSTASLRLAAL